MACALGNALGAPAINDRSESRSRRRVRGPEQQRHQTSPINQTESQTKLETIDTQQIEFKKRSDPMGLMNPGKTRGWTSDMAVER